MAVNPLFTDGFYFFSDMYDDRLLSEFAVQANNCAYLSAVQNQDKHLGREYLPVYPYSFFKLSLNDLKVDLTFNREAGFDKRTLSAEINGFTFPIADKRAFYRNYSITDEFRYVPIWDTYSKPTIFDKRVLVQFGPYQIMKAVFTFSKSSRLRIVLPYDAEAQMSYDSWGTRDYEVLKQYIADHADDPNDTYNALWIFTDEISHSLHYSNSSYIRSNLVYDDDLGGFVLTLPVSGCTIANKIDRESDENSWDFYAYDGGLGNIYLQTDCTLVSRSSTEYRFLIPTEFINQTLMPTIRQYAGIYGYFIKRPNRRHVAEITKDSRNQVLNLNYIKNPAGVSNIEIYEYDADNHKKLARLFDKDLVRLYYPNFYDFSSVNINNAHLRIEVIEYLPPAVSEEMRDSLKPVVDSLGDFFYDFVVNGYDIVDENGESRMQEFAPTPFRPTSEGYHASEYFGDLRGYMLNCLLNTMKTDAYLNVLYYNFIDGIDPSVVSLQGTPKDFGFNTQLSGEYTGSHPIVMNTEGYSDNDDIIYNFEEPHSYLCYRSNGEHVAALVYFNGVYVRPTAHTIYRGMNYLFFPVAMVANMVRAFSTEDLLRRAKPIVVDFYPHTFVSRTVSIEERQTIPSTPFKLFQGITNRKTLRIREIAIFDSGRNWITDWLKHFDVLLEVNKYEIKSVTADRNYVLLRKDQDINSIIPILSGLYPHSTITPMGTEFISLHDTVDKLVESGVVDKTGIYRLINKSLPLDDLYLKALDTYAGAELTFTLNSFMDVQAFKGSDLNISGTRATITIEHALMAPPHPAEEGIIQYLLFQNGTFVRDFNLIANDTIYGSPATLTIYDDDIDENDEFKLIHLPIPVRKEAITYSKGMKYMRPGNPFGKDIPSIWPDFYIPWEDGLMVLDNSIESNSFPLEHPTTVIYTDNGYRMPHASKSTYSEGAAYYDESATSIFPDQCLDSGTVLRRPTDLSIATGVDLPAMNLLNWILRPLVTGLHQIRLELDPFIGNIQSVEYGKNMLVVKGNFFNGAYKYKGMDDWEEMVLCDFWALEDEEDGRILADDDSRILVETEDEWRVIGYKDDRFIALGFNNDAAAYSKDGITWGRCTLPRVGNWVDIAFGNTSMVAIATDSRYAAYSTDGIIWDEIELPAERRWTSIAFGNDIFVAIAADSDKCIYSADGITWSEAEISSGSWDHVIFTGTGFTILDTIFDRGLFSIDGINWGPISLPSKVDWFSVITGETHFSTVVPSNGVMENRFGAYSTDGTNWQLTATETFISDFAIDDRSDITLATLNPLIYEENNDLTIGFITQIAKSYGVYGLFDEESGCVLIDDDGAYLVDINYDPDANAA